MNGDKIRDEREARGWTQEQLAQRVGVGARTIGNWERGETVPKNRLGRLTRIFADETVVPGPESDRQDSTDNAGLIFRRPEGMSDDEWERLQARMQGYWAALADEVALER